MSVDLAADDAAQCSAAQSRAGIAADQVTRYTAQYRTSSGIALCLGHARTCTQRSSNGDQGQSFSQERLAHGVFSVVG